MPRRSLLLPVVLGLLVTLLAGLQYRWLGQISTAQRAQMQAVLSRHAEAFGRDFDREILRLYLVFRNDELADYASEAFSRRYDLWLKTARYPQMLSAVYLAGRAGEHSPLLKYDSEASAFLPSPWPRSFESLRPRSGPAHEAVRTGEPARPPSLGTSPRGALNPAVFIVLPNAGAFDERDAREVRTLLASRVGARRIVLVLDRAYLQGSLVPTLAALHFAEDDSIRYELTVVDPLDPENPIYRRGVARAARQSWQTADVRVPLFSPPLDVAAAWMMTGYFSEGANDIVELKSNLIVGAGPTGEGWQLLVTHSAGSLDAAVTQMRRRNLWLSFGILAVLAAGVGLVAANARRSQQIAQQQMDFVVTISHELRTPLAVIRSAAENLTTKLATDTVKVAQYGKLIEAEGRRLSDMVEQVLAFAGLTGTRPQTTRLIDVGAMARAVVAARDELITGGHVEISLVVDEPLPRISGDERAIRRAVEELVINAGKHGGEGGWIGIAVRRVSIRGREEVHLSVSDRGRGIDAADLPHIFEPFYRGRRAWDRQVQGSGFGLSLVARTADAHGGRVAATSTGGETTVTLCLPIARNAGDSQAAAPEA